MIRFESFERLKTWDFRGWETSWTKAKMGVNHGTGGEL